MNVVIIGAGQLGSRHLQGLALIEESLHIYLIDPSEESLQLSKERFIEVDTKKNKILTLLKDNTNLPKEIEFAIISTTSKYRLEVMNDLLEACNVKYLLLEKFLFPLQDEYKKAEEIIANCKTDTYVNCTRRQFDGYKKLKEKFSRATKIALTVEGSNWNIASNAIHFVDLFQFLTSSNEIVYDYVNSDLQKEKSKHQGYVEFNGQIKATSIEGHSLTLICRKEEKMSFSVKIEVDDSSYLIDEANQSLICDTQKEHFPVYFQSQLTNKTFEQLQQQNKSDLISFNDSCKLHLDLLKLFNYVLRDEKGIVT